MKKPRGGKKMTAIFQSFGFPELGVILLVALIIFGPSKLPEIGRSVGKALREFRASSSEVTKALTEGLQGEAEGAPEAGSQTKVEASAEKVTVPEDKEAPQKETTDA
jgi:sec-independent protein translocase protein TatA